MTRRSRLLARAAWHGDVGALGWARATLEGADGAPCWGNGVCYAAAKGGSIAALQWLRQHGSPCPWDEWVCVAAAEGGHLHMLQWLRQQEPPCPWDGWTSCEAAMSGHLQMLQWVLQQEPPCPFDRINCLWLADNMGHTDIAAWIRSLYPVHQQGRQGKVLGGLCSWVASAPHAERGRAPLQQQQAVPTAERFAAACGHLHVLPWMRGQEPPCPWNDWVCVAAVEGGHLQVLQWLRKQESPFDRDTCLLFAKAKGHSEVVDWIESL
ncbi:MAG: hypothetical protein J3K34DRAFT_381607 [Monoraphidium minutum]|nr:MAG: hypothetical protein J3K34DRAFT_381607 [Monoraphidium minutum]